MTTNDSLVLLEDGVFAALEHNPYTQQLKTLKACYAIEDDLLARGLSNIAGHINPISYNDFVRLSCSHQSVKSWY